MAATKFNRIQLEAVLSQVAESYLGGKKQHEIGADLGVSQQQVTYYLKKLQKRWQDAAVEAIDARKARELARLDQVEREAWEGWARSCEAAETMVARSKQATFDEASLLRAKAATPIEESEHTYTVKGQAGDAGFLNLVMKCVEMRLKIVGGFAPEKLEIDWREDMQAHGLQPDSLVDELFAKVKSDGQGNSV